MLKALVRKQLTELGNMFFRFRKKGKAASSASKAGTVILFAFLFICLACGMFSLGMGLGVTVIGHGHDWLYFALIGLVTLLFGVLGSAFTSYGGLYLARDNDFLLSMPIPPRMILFSRMLSVVLLTLFYTALVWIPGVIAYLLIAESVSALTAVGAFLLLIPLSLVATALSCLLGFFVAIIAVRLKNKNFLTVLITLAFLAVYYIIYFGFMGRIEEILANLDAMSEQLKSSLYVFYQLGLAACGELLPFVLVFLAGFAVFALLIVVLGLNFSRIVTMNRGEKKKVYKRTSVKAESADRALLRRELKRFTGCPAYMLNGGLGLIIMPALAVLAIVKRSSLTGTFAGVLEAVPQMEAFLPVLAALAIALIASMNMISAPSVSLEGKNYWITRSLPVSTQQILNAKEKLQLLLNTPVAMVSVLLICLVFELGLPEILCALAFTLVFNLFSADLGLVMSLKKADLDWTNEVVPIKQGMSVFFSLMFGWLSVIALAALAFWLVPYIGGCFYLLAVSALLALVAFLLRRYIMTHGCELYETLA